MIYNVTVGEKTYAVEIEDLNQRPVVTRVDGEVFRVWVERQVIPPQVSAAPVEMAAQKAIVASVPVGKDVAENALVSPLPGTVVEILVKPGEQVEAGQVLIIIEAMKMKNSLRSLRSGVIKSVLVSAGQIVAHRQPLVEYES